MSSLRNIIILGDLTHTFDRDLQQLLHVKDNANLCDFFNQASRAFRREFASLPQTEQEWLPRFTDLIDLLENVDGTEGASALRFALLPLYEIGRFISHFGQGSRPYPSATDTYLLGLCTGSFAAAAIATSQTIAELVPAGVEAVLHAFLTGLHSLKLQHDLEKPLSNKSRSWSVVVSLPEKRAIEVVESFGAESGLPKRSRPYISAVSPANVTISGPPSALADLLDSRALKAHSLPIESPYHAPHLYGTDEVLVQLEDKRLETYKLKIPILSPVSGTPIPATDFKALILQAIHDSLCEQVRWDKIVTACADVISKDEACQSCTILPLASNAAPLLSSMLSSSTKVSVFISNSLNTDVGTTQDAMPTGRFKDSKIAVIGFSGRYPEAASNEEFWELLRTGKDTHRTIPEDRFNWKAHFDPTGKTKNTSRVKYGCFINEPGLFDARFFHLSPLEAEDTDPAQRLALMATYEALEMAGFVPDRTPSTQRDRLGVFFGVTSDDWREVNSGQNVGTYFIPGGNRAFVPGRISYFFRFSGPSLSIDTACSSSFAAIQTACLNLWQGCCDTAIAGGTNILTNPDNFAGLDRGHFLSTTGNCNPFDDDASGYCRADAVGSVILKRLEDAEADNDPIFGVIAGINTNHCGQTVSITRPHEGDQLSLFRRILRHTNTNPLDVSYVEMHGTGTQAGDAAEMNSVLSAFERGYERMPRHPLYLGGVKANVGHSESSSGVSALIKVLMMLQHNEIPPHIGIKNRINRNYPVDLADRNVNIVSKPTPWRRVDCPSGKRVSFLNNFSAAGGNTAVLLEDAPERQQDDSGLDPRTVHPVTVTARSLKSLKENIAALIGYLECKPDTSLPALSYTTTARRTHHKFRTSFVGSDITSIKNTLKRRLDNCGDVTAIPSPRNLPGVVFTFTGQGALYVGIGRQLFERLDHFRSDILHFNRIAQRQGFQSFLPLIKCGPDELAIESVETVVSHLALVCVQMALYRLWVSWGVIPSFVIGHSLGEYPALFAAGVLTASDTIYLVGHPSGAPVPKLYKGKSFDGGHQGTPECPCANSPTNTVVSGPSEEIDHLTKEFRSQGLECVRLSIPYAFHSAQVEPFLEAFGSAASRVQFHAPTVPCISPLLARTISESEVFNASYLSQACRATVNFQGAIEAARYSAIVNDQTHWLEIGSHPVCSSFIKRTMGSHAVTLPSLRQDKDPWKVLVSGLERLYLSGIEIQWNEYHRDFPAAQQVLPLPSYRWDLKNYWIMYKNNFCLTKGDDPMPTHQDQLPSFANTSPPMYLSSSVHRVLEEHNAADKSTLLTESDIHDPCLAPIIQGHKVNGAALCPSSLYADMALTIAGYMLKANKMWTQDMGMDCGKMKVDRPLIASPDSNSQLLRVSASSDWSRGEISLAFFSVNADARKIADHATCLVKLTPRNTWLEDWKRNTYLIQGRISSLQQSVDGGRSHKLKRGLAYKLFSSLVDYANRYQGIQEVVLDSDSLEATAQVVFQVGDDGFDWNPCWIDSLGHIAGFIMNGNDNVHSKDQVFVNHGWSAMRCAKKIEHGKTYQTYNRMLLESGTTYAGDTYILEDDVIVAIFQGVKFQGVPRSVLDQLLPSKARALKPAQNLPLSTLATSGRPVAPKAMTVQERSVGPQPTAVPVIAPVQREQHSGAIQTNTASRLKSIISEEAGIEIAELEPELPFADIGIDSLLSLTISSRLQEELGLNFSSASFIEFPTLRDMMNYIAESGTETPASDGGSVRAPARSENDKKGNETNTTSVDEEPNIMDIIRATIADEAGASLEELTTPTMLSELGVDSLLSLTIMGRLRELELELPPSLLVENPTLLEIENALVMSGFLPAAKPTAPREPLKDVSLPVQLSQIALDGPPYATSVRLQGSSKTATKTLFLLPDGSGSATSYASLPDISPEFVVYGLNCPWMRSPQDLKCSLEQYVAKFLNEICRKQPTGPYYFGGWSAGGILAYEAAQQLAREGENTAKLILLDSPDPVGLENPPQRMYDFLDMLDMFGTNGKTAPSWLRPHFEAFLTMLDGYKVSSFRGKAPATHIVYARDGICKNPGDPRPKILPGDPREMLWLLNNRTDFTGGGWKDLLGGTNLHVHVIDEVNHYTILAPGKGIGKLRSIMAQVLER